VANRLQGRGGICSQLSEVPENEGAGGQSAGSAEASSDSGATVSSSERGLCDRVGSGSSHWVQCCDDHHLSADKVCQSDTDGVQERGVWRDGSGKAVPRPSLEALWSSHEMGIGQGSEIHFHSLERDLQALGH
jgi:hypothetical protein